MFKKILMAVVAILVMTSVAHATKFQSLQVVRDVSIGGALTNAGAIVQSGATTLSGTNTLSGSNTLSGATTVSGLLTISNTVEGIVRLKPQTSAQIFVITGNSTPEGSLWYDVTAHKLKVAISGGTWEALH